jgi:putative ABC transport system permease protein
MNRSTLRKIWGDLWTRKGRTALVSISIFIGVVGVVTLITAGDLLVRQLKADIKADELPMLQIFAIIPPSEGQVQLDDPTYINDLKQAFPDITAVDASANNPFYWKFQDEGRFREARLLSYVTPMQSKPLEPMRLVSGSYPQPGQHQLAVEQRMAESEHLTVGEQIDVRMLGLPGLPTETWTISGIVFHAYNDSPTQSMYVPYSDAPSISGVNGINILGIRFTDFATAKASQEAVQQYITNHTPYSAVFVMARDPQKNQAIQSTEQFAAILSVLAVVAMLVSGFLVLNVVNNLVIEQRRQIGVMKSLGATRTETFLIYGGVAVSYGLIGMIPGVLIGIPLGYRMAVLVGSFANTLIDKFAVSPLAITLGVALGSGVPIVSSILPVYMGTRVTILEAMTDLGIGGGYNIGFLNRLIKRLPLPLNIKQSFNNLTQKKMRLALTAFTLTLALTAFMGVSAVFVRINDVLQGILNSFEYQVIFQTTKSQDFDTVQTLLMNNVQGIKEVYPGAGYIAQLQGYINQQSETSQIFLQGVVPETAFRNTNLVAGTAWENDPNRKGIVLTNEITNQIHKTVGDTVTITANGKPLDLEIIGIVNYPFPLGIMPWQDLAQFTGFTLGAPTPNQYFTAVQINGYQGTLPDHQITAWGIDEQIAGMVTLVQGSLLVAGQPGVMISQQAANDGGYSVGDQVTVQPGECAPSTTSSGSSPTCTATVPIVGIFTLPAQLAAAPVPPDIMAFYWQDLAALEGISLEGKPVPNAFYVLTAAKNPSASQVDQLIDNINTTLVDHGITASYTNMVQIADMASRAILSIGIVLNLASAIMAAVGAIGLITTLSIAVFERQKEIGVMRSVGAKSPTIIMQFLIEGMVVGLLAWLLAAPLSVALAWGLTSILPFGDFIKFAYPPIMLVLGFVGIVIIAIISSVWPSVAAARKTVSNILRYQ